MSFLSKMQLHSIELELTERPSRLLEVNLGLVEKSSLTGHDIVWPGARANLALQNDGECIRLQLRLKTAQRLEHLLIRFSLQHNPSHILCNGYNDWTGSREFRFTEKTGLPLI